MYAQDSFFDLSRSGQFGLVCISAVLFVLWVLLTRFLLRDRAPWLKIGGALILFWVFVWVSPQVYYQYYRLIIPDLPLQWVIWPPAAPQEAISMLFFQGPQNLSAHSQGLLGWSLLLVPFLSPGRHSESRPANSDISG
ncbi:MAG: hypothetical protein AAGD13_07915 [Pseudomonadota bacterium]